MRNKKIYRYKAHPWHGIELGADAPDEVTAFIEIVPTDTYKYEVDKVSGYLSIDRPQQYSNTVPTLYGFLPRTYCGRRVAELMNLSLGRTDIEGDGDPLDICILTERDVTHGDIIARVRPIGGFSILDDIQADEKIVAVLTNDAVYGAYNDIREVPEPIVDRLIHYFTTYKNLPSAPRPRMVLHEVYGPERAREVIRRSIEDYKTDIEPQLS